MNKLFNKLPTTPLGILVFLGFITTGYISFQLVSTMCKTFMQYVIAFNMTLILQLGSFYFYHLAVTSKIRKIRNWSLAITLFAVSIIATTSLSINQINESRNELLLSSKGYEQQIKAEETKDKIIKLKEAEITALQKECEMAIASIDSDIFILNQEIEMWKQREKKENQLYYGQINRVKKEIQGHEQEKRNTRIKFADKVQVANENLANAYMGSIEQQPSSDIELELEGTKGYLGFITTVQNMFHINFDIAMLLMQLILAVIFEITIISFHVEYVSRKPAMGRGSEDKQSNVKQSNVKQFKPKQFKIKQPTKSIKPKVVAKKSGQTNTRKTQPIGFNMNNNKVSFNEQEVKEYTQAMYKYRNGNKSAGYKFIAENTSLSQNKCREIKKYLESEKVIETINNATYIL